MGQSKLTRLNRQAALQLIRRNGGMSRYDLSRSLRFKPVALTKIARSLLASGRVVEKKDPAVNVGRPQTKLLLNSNAGRVFCISLTHTLDVGIVDLSGKLIWKKQLGMECDGIPYTDAFDHALPEFLTTLLKETDFAPVLGIGVLVSGRIDRSGVIQYFSGLPGGKADIRKRLRQFTDLPIMVDQEFRLLLRLHRWDEPEEVKNNIVAFSGRWWGFGSSQAALVDGRLCRGRRGFAGQAGRRMPVLHDVDEIQIMRAKVKAMGGENVYLQKIRAGDATALDVFGQVVDNYGYRLAQIVNYFDPEMILIYGPYSELGEIFLEPVRQVMARNMEPGDLDGLILKLAGERTAEVCLRAAAIPVLEAAISQDSGGGAEALVAAEAMAERLLGSK